jgi:glucokinase
MTLALVADIGGTNARFALAPLEGGRPQEQVSWRTADFSGLEEAARAFLEQVGETVALAAIAVAAPSDSGEVSFTNSHWRFSRETVRGALGLDHLLLVNDFAANGWALPELGEAQLRPIGAARPKARHGTFAVLGPGTGLGVCAVRIDQDANPVVLETEGGHVDFAPLDAEEEAVLAELRSRFGRVSCERVLSGQGLANIHRALFGSEHTPEAITAAAAAGEGDACRTVALFCRALGSFAGNGALAYGAWDGVYLSGALLRTVEGELTSGGFRARFEAKGRFSGRLAAVPTMVIDEPALGLIGAAAALRRLLRC